MVASTLMAPTNTGKDGGKKRPQRVYKLYDEQGAKLSIIAKRRNASVADVVEQLAGDIIEAEYAREVAKMQQELRKKPS